MEALGYNIAIGEMTMNYLSERQVKDKDKLERSETHETVLDDGGEDEGETPRHGHSAACASRRTTPSTLEEQAGADQAGLGWTPQHV